MKYTNKIERIGRIIFRTPILPLKNTYMPINFTELMQDQIFLCALFLASPILYEETLRYKNGQIDSTKDKRKIEESLIKYYLRMSSRCTPFGLFSACGSLQEGNNSYIGDEKIVLPSVSNIKRCSRLDMNYICSLSLYISNLPEVIIDLKFYPNTSLYSMGKKWRYIEYYYSSGNRVHQISSVDKDTLVNKIIKESSKGITFNDVQNIIKNEGIDCNNDEILEYFKDLIGSNILVSELEPSITGADFLTLVICKLENIKTDQITHLINVLRNVKRLLTEADSIETSITIVEIYKKIMALLKTLEVEIDESKLFQVDSFWELNDKQFLRPELYSDLDIAVNVLEKITPPHTNENLTTFIQRFIERFEGQELPLMYVLDPESGIGYLQENKNGNFNQSNINWGKKDSLLYDKLQECLSNKQNEIILNEKDIESLKEETTNVLPPSFAVMFRIVQKDNTKHSSLLVESVGGSSAVNLLGRFASNDINISNQIRNICSEEEDINSEVVFAEIIHIPQSRIGNIILHPPFRKLEIPYVGLSSLSADKQVLPEDLLISVKNNKIILRSKRLNKVVIPRLSNAYNYSLNSQPVFRFLCDLQFQGISPWLNFDWGSLVRINKFLPRIAYKNVILQPSTWNLNKEDISNFLNNKSNNLDENFKDFCQYYRLPTIFLLSEGDNDLPINSENNQHIDIFLSAIKNKSQITLKEFLLPSNNIEDTRKNVYNNEFVASYLKKDETYSAHKVIQNKKIKSPKRIFNQNSEWLYFKIYCGIKTSNDILIKSIYRCVNSLKKEKVIDSWFFIRYADPHNHLRIRFHIPENKTGNKEYIISKFINSVKHYEKNGLVWNIVIDTYKREIERYQDVIEYAEKFFHFDSNAVVSYLKHNCEDDALWWMYGIKSIDQTFNDLNLSLSERQTVVNTLSISFNEEFRAGKREKVELDSLYRERYTDICNILENTNLSDVQAKTLQILSVRSLHSLSTVNEAFSQFTYKNEKQKKFEFLISYIHMIMNRLYMTNARQNEMVMYNLMLKYYTSKLARSKYSK